MVALRLLITGGGTAGHVMPALAVLEHLPSPQALWLGTNRLDAKLVPQANIRHLDQRLTGFAGGGRLAALGRLVGSSGKVKALVREFAPTHCLATGGYASVPGALASRLTKARLILIEPNALPGKATKLLAPFAQRIAATPAGAALLGAKARPVGVPVRQAITQATREAARTSLSLPPTAQVIAVTGGSQGAQALNGLLLAALALPAAAPLRQAHLLWQTGPKGDDVAAGVGEWPGGATTAPYTNALAQWLAAADVVISRAGANTLAEVAALGRRAVLLPLKGGGGDQIHNARAHAEGGGAVVLPHGAAPTALLEALTGLLEQEEPPPAATNAAAEVAGWLLEAC